MIIIGRKYALTEVQVVYILQQVAQAVPQIYNPPAGKRIWSRSMLCWLTWHASMTSRLIGRAAASGPQRSRLRKHLMLTFSSLPTVIMVHPLQHVWKSEAMGSTAWSCICTSGTVNPATAHREVLTCNLPRHSISFCPHSIVVVGTLSTRLCVNLIG